MINTLPRRISARKNDIIKKHLGLNERLGLIGLIEEGIHLGSSDSPIVTDLFNDLWNLVNKTVSGSRLDQLKPEDSRNGFHVFEIISETGETLCRLNMLYLKKPIPCYYLVYVEVAVPYRKMGLGNRILENYRNFLISKSAIGILDNIIPKEDPTYDIYFKQAWEPIESVIGGAILDRHDNYMIYIPPGFEGKDIKKSVLRLVHHLKRKRPAIDMRDNEVMVQRTISEFKDLYSALLAYFETEIQRGESSPTMRFMFTRFVTKLISFRRRIGVLLGYTGGESLETILLKSEIAELPIKSYAPREIASKPSFVTGDKKLWLRLPDALKKHPAHFIELLPNYNRPRLIAWLQKQGVISTYTLTISDLMDLGFDPTRLKEISLNNEEFIFERVQARQLPDLKKKKELLELMASRVPGVMVRNAQLKSNPPLLTVRDRGNAYVLRRKISGIHWEEAVEQIHNSPQLREINAPMKLDKMIRATVREANEMITHQLGVEQETIPELITYFVSWNLKTNQPKLTIDFTGTYLESIWTA